MPAMLPLANHGQKEHMIADILTAPTLGAFFYDDQRAIRAGAQQVGFDYTGEPVTPGFSRIRVPGQALGVGLVLDDSFVAWGDMMTVQYSAAGGREPVFNRDRAQALLDGPLKPRLLALDFSNLREDIARVFAPLPDGSSVPSSVQYGLSQALLGAYAHRRRLTIAEVLADAYDLLLIAEPVPIYAQSGDERKVNVQKMVMKRVDVLPHGLINTPAKFGQDGRLFADYAKWVAAQVNGAADPAYQPTLHFDLYGNAGIEFHDDPLKIAEYIARVAESVAPYQLHIESPADYGSTDNQIEGFLQIRHHLNALGCNAKIVADEWCDTLADVERFCKSGAADIVQIKMPDVGSVTHSFEAVLLCKAHGVGAYLGGSCVETDLSARISVHAALASRADMQLAKPGMGVDEALTIVGNEQARLLALLRAKNARRG
ncbi:MAG TPA: methylaspartate ammonia-lyase [Caballeronia sp.]|jgi:methylaspartate ammonia-lyase|nr:methylaspartate ammonia-lyase [Caballeronia sp.]